MAKLPKRLIKKFGISKKAWSVFRGEKKGSTRSRKTTRVISTRRKGASKVAKKRRRKKSSKKDFLGLGSDIILMGVGSGLAGTIGALAGNFVPQLAGNIGQGLIGGLLASTGRGAVKNIGKGMLIKTIGDLFENSVAPLVLGSAGLGGNQSMLETTTIR